MRITLVISSLAAGGAQRVIIDLAKHLTSRGHHVTLLTYSDPRIDHFSVPLGIERIALNLLWPSKGLADSIYSNFRRLTRLRAALVAAKPSVIVSFIDLTNVLVLAATRGLGVPVVISERIHPKFHRIDFQWRIARRLLYPFADCLVVQTAVIARWARRIVPQKRVRVIPNSVASLSTDERPLPREDVILAVGRLHLQKGFDLLIRAFAASGIWRKGWRLVIIGEGPERAHLQALVAERDLQSSVSLPGETARPQDWYRRCGIFVLSSRFEGFPNVLLEAMSLGASCVTFDCPSGPAEIVRPGVDAVLLPREDVDGLASTLSRLAMDSATRTSMGSAASTIGTRFSPDVVFAEWERLLQDMAPQTAAAKA